MNARAWILPLSLLSAAPAAAQSRIDAGAAVEDYSFFKAAGVNTWTQGLFRGRDGRFGILAGQSTLRRFGFTDSQGSLGGVARLSARGSVEAKLSIAPEAQILPQWAVDALAYQGLPRAMTLTPGYRFSRYAIADVHTWSLGWEWENRRLSVTLRPYLSLNYFRQGPVGGRAYPAFFAELRVPLSSGILLAPSYAWREEAFQAGAPGRFSMGSFKAHTGRIEARLPFGEPFLLRLAWSYEGRIPMAYLRQYEAGLTLFF